MDESIETTYLRITLYEEKETESFCDNDFSCYVSLCEK